MNEKVKKMYHLLDRAVDLIRTSSESYKSYLSFASGIYKYGFSDSLLIYAQKPCAVACATLELWNKLGRRIRSGSKGIPLIDDSTENVRLRYVYDLKDTYGEEKTLPRVWSLRREYQKSVYDYLENSLNIKGATIIDESDLPSCYIKIVMQYAYREMKKDNPNLNEVSEQDYIITLAESTAYMVNKRCQLEIDDFSFNSFVPVSWDVYTVKKLGVLAHKYSYGILKLIEGKVKELDRENAREPEAIPVDRKDNFKQDPADRTYTQLRLDDMLQSGSYDNIKNQDIGGMNDDGSRDRQVEQTGNDGERPHAETQTPDVQHTPEGRDSGRNASTDAGGSNRGHMGSQTGTQEDQSATRNRQLHGELEVQPVVGGHNLGNGEGQDIATGRTESVKLKNRQIPEGAIKAKKPDSSFFNETSRVAATVQGYEDAVENAKKGELNLVNLWVLLNETELAKRMYKEQDIKFLQCEHASEIISGILKKANIPHTVESGIIEDQSHAWIRVNNDTVLDPAASSLGRILTPRDYINAKELRSVRYDIVEGQTFFDNPVRAANSLPNYSEAVDTARKGDFLGINHWVLDNESALARLILKDEDAEFIYCDHAAEIVSDILRKAGVSHSVEVGIINKQSHMWVRVGKETLIDPTISQFGRRLKVEDYNNAQELHIKQYDFALEKEKSNVEPKSKAPVFIKPKGVNFHITPEDNIGSGGIKTKYKDNIAAIKLLKLIEEEGRLATPDEQKNLARYVGCRRFFHTLRMQENGTRSGMN